MRSAPVAVHNRTLELAELIHAATGKLRCARGRARKGCKEQLEALEAEKAAIYAASDTWPEIDATMSYGVAAPCGRRVSHYMSFINGAWVRHE